MYYAPNLTFDDLNPIPHGVSDSVAAMGGGPKKSRKESFLTPGSFRPEWYCTLHCDGFFRKFQNFKIFKIACLELILMTN